MTTAKYEVIVQPIGAKRYDKPLFRDAIDSCEGCPRCHHQFTKCLETVPYRFIDNYYKGGIPEWCPLGMGREPE